MVHHKPVRGIAFDTESVLYFVKLMKEGEWKEKDLNEFVSTKGIQYIIQKERESGLNSSEDIVKTFLKNAKKGISGEQGGWTAALGANVEERLDYLLRNWDALVVQPFAAISDYMPERGGIAGTCYFVPGGALESHSGPDGIAINIGYGGKEKTRNEWIFLLIREIYYYWITRVAGEPSISKCETPSEFIEAFLSTTCKRGMALFMGLKAAGLEKTIEPLKITDRTAFGEAFLLALEGEAPQQRDRIEKVFSGHHSPSALIGLTMAKAIHECGGLMGKKLGKEALFMTFSELGYFPFFEIFKSCDTRPSVLPDSVWKAFDKVKKERNLTSANDIFFLGGKKNGYEPL